MQRSAVKTDVSNIQEDGEAVQVFNRHPFAHAMALNS